MNTSDVLRINMLGQCSLSVRGNTLDNSTIHSKKIWLLLEYLIINRNRDISQDELIEVIYPNENSANPLNALKTLIHRARSILDTLEYVSGKNMIVQRRGGYAWNPELNIEVDIDKFESKCQAAADTSLPDSERLTLLTDAINLYSGDFLLKNAGESWVIPLSTYYRSMFISAIDSALEILVAQNEYSEIVTICQKGISIDPYNESLYYNLMKALAGMNQPMAALAQYDSMLNLFYSEFGVTPSGEIKALYKELVKSSHSVELDLSIIKEHLREYDDSQGAFYCEYEFFKDVYRLEVRSMGRTGKPVHIGLITVNGPDNVQLPLKSLNTAMDKLKVCTQSSLRRGDTFSRYSVSQYILMLPTTTYSNAELVTRRIVKRYYRENPRSKAVVSYSIQAIDAAL